MSDQTNIDITYKEPNFDVPKDVVRVETIYGSVPRVSSVPTWIPRMFKDGFAIYVNGATYRFYIYDNVGNTWKYSALT